MDPMPSYSAPEMAVESEEPAPMTDSGALPNLRWEGLVDSYYLFKLTGDRSLEDPELRAFDTDAHSFRLAYAKLAVQMDADPVGFRIDFGYGQVGQIINGLSDGASGIPGIDRPSSLYSSAFIVQQAYATATFGGILTLDAGKFNTTAGAEVTESNGNWLYSRSFLFNGIPLLHTGLRLTVSPNDMISIQASLVNGGVTNNDPDNNAWKTLGLSLGVTPVEGTSLALTSYLGKEGDQGMQGDMQFLLDFVAAQDINESIGLNLNFDFWQQGDAQWLGTALMANFVLHPNFRLAVRGEWLSSKDGGYGGLGVAGGDRVNLFEGTLLLGLPVGSNYEIRLETRADFASEDDAVFHKGVEAKGAQVTGQAAFLAWF